MIVFRNGDVRYPFLWEDERQHSARWHDSGDGPVHYFADTPNGAWAEFLRHEEIEDPADLAGVRRAMWAVEIGNKPTGAPALPLRTLLGGEDSYPDCQSEAKAVRADRRRGLVAPSASLLPGGARGYRTDNGLIESPQADGETIVLFGPRPDLIGWLAAAEARPAVALLDRVRSLT